jgi:hypothetical protein
LRALKNLGLFSVAKMVAQAVFVMLVRTGHVLCLLAKWRMAASSVLTMVRDNPCEIAVSATEMVLPCLHHIAESDNWCTYMHVRGSNVRLEGG